MATTKIIKVSIAEPSELIRVGIETMLKRLTQYRITIVDLIQDEAELSDELQRKDVDILIINPILCGTNPKLLGFPAETKIIALIGHANPSSSLFRRYNGVLNVLNLTTEELQEQLQDLMEQNEEQDGNALASNSETESLTPREKEIVICVVKGMTNKEIAKTLFLSTHTVITHRRNISKKLQIHSASGLTIYAIVNKLVELDEINS